MFIMELQYEDAQHPEQVLIVYDQGGNDHKVVQNKFRVFYGIKSNTLAEEPHYVTLYDTDGTTNPYTEIYDVIPYENKILVTGRLTSAPKILSISEHSIIIDNSSGIGKLLTTKHTEILAGRIEIHDGELIQVDRPDKLLRISKAVGPFSSSSWGKDGVTTFDDCKFETDDSAWVRNVVVNEYGVVVNWANVDTRDQSSTLITRNPSMTSNTSAYDSEISTTVYDNNWVKVDPKFGDGHVLGLERNTAGMVYFKGSDLDYGHQTIFFSAKDATGDEVVTPIHVRVIRHINAEIEIKNRIGSFELAANSVGYVRIHHDDVIAGNGLNLAEARIEGPKGTNVTAPFNITVDSGNLLTVTYDGSIPTNNHRSSYFSGTNSILESVEDEKRVFTFHSCSQTNVNTERASCFSQSSLVVDDTVIMHENMSAVPGDIGVLLGYDKDT